MDNNEDAMTHGVMVVECEPRYQRQYYEYLLQKRNKGTITESYFQSLTKDYNSTSRNS